MTQIWTSFKSQLSRNRYLGERPELDPVLRLALVTGFLGALTTFSSFSAEVVAMLQQGRFALAAGTASLHLLGSLALTVLGLKTVGLLWVR